MSAIANRNRESQRSYDLYTTSEAGTKQSFVRILVRVIAAVSNQAYVVVRVAGPGDAGKNNTSSADASHHERADTARPKIGIQRRAVKDAGAWARIEAIARLDRKIGTPAPAPLFQ